MMWVGIDPGIVHTGVVLFVSDDVGGDTMTCVAKVFDGMNVGLIKQLLVNMNRPHAVYIEAYNPRSHFGTDRRMVEGVAAIHAALPGSKLINNTGVKKVVTADLMKLLGVWDFPGQVTHHQDLRAAARIGLYGAMKDPVFNERIYRTAVKILDGVP